MPRIIDLAPGTRVKWANVGATLVCQAPHPTIPAAQLAVWLLDSGRLTLGVLRLDAPLLCGVEPDDEDSRHANLLVALARATIQTGVAV